MTYKVAIDAGHGYNTAGKRTPDGEREWSFNDVVARAFVSELTKYSGVTVRRYDDITGKTDVPLRTRTDKANAWGADIFVSFHHNAHTGVWGAHTGTETYYHGGSTEGRKLADMLQKACVRAYGLRDRGIKTANLHITRETKMPAVLVEGGFMDSTVDIVKLRDDKVLAQAGRNIAGAVAEYLGVKKASDKPAPKPAKPASRPSKPKAKPKSKLSVDGKWGQSTTRALQAYLGTPTDGIISGQLRNNASQSLYGNTVHYGKGGSTVVRELQRLVGAKADGLLGPATVRALQTHLKTPVDGKLSRPSQVVKAVQRNLNAGVL